MSKEQIREELFREIEKNFMFNLIDLSESDFNSPKPITIEFKSILGYSGYNIYIIVKSHNINEQTILEKNAERVDKGFKSTTYHFKLNEEQERLWLLFSKSMEQLYDRIDEMNNEKGKKNE